VVSELAGKSAATYTPLYGQRAMPSVRLMAVRIAFVTATLATLLRLKLGLFKSPEMGISMERLLFLSLSI